MVQPGVEVETLHSRPYGTFGQGPSLLVTRNRLRLLAFISTISLVGLLLLSFMAHAREEQHNTFPEGLADNKVTAAPLLQKAAYTPRKVIAKGPVLDRKTKMAIYKSVDEAKTVLRPERSIIHRDIGIDARKLEAIQDLAKVEMQLHDPDMGSGDSMHLRQEVIADKKRLAEIENSEEAAV